MPIFREEYAVRRSSHTCTVDVSIDTYDYGLCYTTDGKLRKANAEAPQFVATSNCSAEDSVSVAPLNRGFRCALRPAASVSAGQHITTNSSGQFVAAATAETAALAAGSVGVWLENGAAGDYVECDILRGV